MSWLVPKRQTEASANQLAVSGAAGAYGYDPVDGDVGFTRVGGGSREVPVWTLEKTRAYSVAAYRINPMAKAIIDTWTSFCVGDSGVTLQCSNPQVKEVVDEFWTDPRNDLAGLQELMLRDHLLMGETVPEMLVGPTTGVCRFSIIDPSRITGVELEAGNPLWPSDLHIRQAGGEDVQKSIIRTDEITGLREGQCFFWPSNKATLTDRRGVPFLSTIIDWLDSYDSVLSNLVDRTALMRYIAFDVTIDGGPADVADFVAKRGGTHVPRSGTVEVHNDKVHWQPMSASTNAEEDKTTAQTLLTNVAAGAGLAPSWLAEPGNTNRATSLTMAEPIRRRVGGIQNMWLARQTEKCRFAVDQAVAVGRLPREVPAVGETTAALTIAASKTVVVTGPSIATADAQVTALVLLNLSQGLADLVNAGVMTREAAQVAAKKGWEDYVGVPYSADLDKPDANVDDIATAVADAGPGSGGTNRPRRITTVPPAGDQTPASPRVA